jgi:predicted nucleic acid-binding protein
MTVEAFMDTNVLLYAASQRTAETRKKARAAELIDTVSFATSAQVLAEFYTIATCKGEPPMTPAEALEWIDAITLNPCVPVDVDIVVRGIELSVRYQTSYWDGAIVAAAEMQGATTLYSEDLSDGQMYGTVRVVNPFKSL